MNPENINWLAVLVSTIVSFIIGFAWYSQMLFGKVWMRVSGMTEEKAKSANMGKVFGSAFGLTLLAAVNLAFFLADPSVHAWNGALYGFLTGFGWVAMSIALMALYELRSFKYILINAGYVTVGFTVAGLILGAWK